MGKNFRQLILKTEDNRQAVLHAHRITPLASRLKFSLFDHPQCFIIGSTADAANNPGVFYIAVFRNDKLYNNPSLDTGPASPFRIVNLLLQLAKSANQLWHLLYRDKEIFFLFIFLSFGWGRHLKGLVHVEISVQV